MITDFALQPDWPAPANIHAYTTLRNSDISQPPHKRIDRELLIKRFHLPNEPIWLHQIHSAIVLPALEKNREQEADASFTHQSQQVCIIQTADCLPILLCSNNGSHIAAIHAGWRGLEKNIIAATLQALAIPGETLLAWIGPCISQACFEVGDEVRDAFLKNDPENEASFTRSPHQRWLADLVDIAKRQLQKLNVSRIYGGNYCTYSDENRFFSYRRDGAETGRLATVIWKD